MGAAVTSSGACRRLAAWPSPVAIATTRSSREACLPGLPPADPSVAAAAYPQVVALTRLLTSLYWRSLAVHFSSEGRSLFLQEMKQAVAPACQWPLPRGSKDPLQRWIIGGNRRSLYDDTVERAMVSPGP